eukprot:s456_g16.t1
MSEVFHPHIDSVVAINPQRHDGYAMLLYYPSALDHLSGMRQIAVILDLSRVGGHYHAAIVPAAMSHHELQERVREHVFCDVDQIDVYVAEDRTPWQAGTVAHLDHGDVLTVVAAGGSPPFLHFFEDLFAPGHQWGALEHIPRRLLTPAVRVLHDADPFTLVGHHFPRQSISSTIAQVLAAEERALALATSRHFWDFDDCGAPCDRCVAVHRWPRPLTEAEAVSFRVVYTFCDLRPLGRHPQCLVSHSFHLHIPTLVGVLDIQVPRDFTLKLEGGIIAGTEILVADNSCLVFSLCPDTDESASSTSDVVPGSIPDERRTDAPSSSESHSSGSRSGPPSGPSSGTTSVSGPGQLGQDNPQECLLTGNLARHGDALGSSPANGKRTGIALTARKPALSPACIDLGVSMPSLYTYEMLCLTEPRWQPTDCVAAPKMVSVHGCSPQQYGLCVHPAFQIVTLQASVTCALYPSQLAALTASVAFKQPDDPGARTAHGLVWPDVLDRVPAPPGPRDGPSYPLEVERIVNEIVHGHRLGDDQWIHAMFLIMPPDTLAEVLSVPLQAPCTVPDALAAVAQIRDDDCSRMYPELYVAEPQPSPLFACLLAAPAWAQRTCIILLDTRPFDGRLFTVSTHSRLNRESLILAAGLPVSDQVAVYSHTRLQPLLPWQMVELTSGTTVTFCPAHLPTPRRALLEHMLQSPRHWDPDADIPQARGVFFLLLTDGLPQLYAQQPQRRQHYRGDVARALLCAEQDLTLRPSFPLVQDVLFHGYIVCAVVVATTAIPRIPVPPGRLMPSQHILIFDCRPILQAFQWLLSPTLTVRFQDLVNRFSASCPEGFTVSITGAEVEASDAGAYFRLRDGHLLRIEFVQDLSSGDDSGSNSSPRSLSSRAASGDSASFHGDRPSPDQTSDRSRSPRPPVVRDRHPAAYRHSFGGLAPMSPCRWPTEDTRVVPCFIFAVGYVAELVMFQPLLWPDSIDLPDAARLSRDGSCARQDDLLLPVSPLEGMEAFFFIAVPSWATLTCVVCVDTLALDGRAYASLAPDTVDIFSALDLIGAPLPADLDVFVDAATSPLRDGEEVGLRPGSRLRFVPHNYAGRPDQLLADFLLACTCGRDTGPGAFLEDSGTVLLVHDDTLTPFSHDPARTSHPFEDIAAALDGDPRRLTVMPAVPKVCDASFRGRNCTYVAAVSFSPFFGRDHQDSLVLADCRQLLRGWFTSWTQSGFFDIAWHIWVLAQSVPDGYVPVCAGHPGPAKWVPARPGQVFVFSLEPAASLPGHVSLYGSASSARNQGGDTNTDHAIPGHGNDDAQGSSATHYGQASDITAPPAHPSHQASTSYAASTNVLGSSQAWMFLIGAFCYNVYDAIKACPLLALCMIWACFSSSCSCGPPLVAAVSMRPLGCALVPPADPSQPSRRSRALPLELSCEAQQGRPSERLRGFRQGAARPVPTPVRARWGHTGAASPIANMHSPRTTADDEVGVLRTLLEEATFVAGADPFLQAAILVDTLLEHFDEFPDWLSKCDRATNEPLSRQLTIGCTPLGFSPSQLSAFRNAPSLLVPLAKLYPARTPVFMKLPSLASLQAFFGQLLALRAHSEIEVWCYTDGSYTPSTTSPLQSLRLILRVACPPVSLLLVALHGPHRATERSVISEWWQDTLKHLTHFCKADHVVMAGDMNAAVGSVPGAHIGDLDPEVEDDAGAWLRDLALRFQLWCPGTFAECHHGPTHTYHQKKSGRLCRPDLLFIPLQWASGHVASFTDPAIHAGHVTQDHVAACADIRFAFVRPQRAPPTACRRIRAADIAHPALRAQVEAVVASTPRVSWNTSVHAHAAIITKHLQEGLSSLSVSQSRRPRHAYIQDATWELQRQVAHIRRAIHNRQARLRYHALLTCLQIWRGGSGSFEHAYLDNKWVKQMILCLQFQVHHLTSLGKALRGALRRDRDAYIEDLARQFSEGPSNHLFSVYHKILVHKRKQPYQLQPLPSINKADGAPCGSSEDMFQRWREHFGGLEAGESTAFLDLVKQACARSTERLAETWPHPTQIETVPSVASLCRILAATKTQKASGIDGVPPELCRHFSAVLAPVLHPLILKQVWRGSEPVGWKGGTSVFFHKRRGPVSECSSYRSVLLLSSLAKASHQSLRPPLKQLFEHSAPPLQMGGKAGFSVTFGSHVLRSVTRLAAQQGKSSLVLYADIASAFYSAVTQLTAGGGEDLPASLVQRLVASLRLTPEDAASLRSRIYGPTAMAVAGAPAWLESLTDMISSNNWFVLRGDTIPIATARGSRPGSSFADLVFALLVPRILQDRNVRRSETLQRSQPHVFPWDGCVNLEPCASDAPPISIDDILWADDIAVPRLCASAHHVSSAVTEETSSLVDACSSHGLNLSFGPYKTAAVLTVTGNGSRAARRQLFGRHDRAGEISVLREHEPAAKLTLVAAYKHLGVYQTPFGRMRTELQYRISQARAAYQARRKVYKNRAIRVARKSTLLESTVLSRLLQGAGSWPRLLTGEQRTFDAAIWSFYRGMLCIPRAALQNITALTCCALVNLPRPAILLRRARLLYLRQLIASGPPQLWAIVKADREYADLLLQDLQWLHLWTRATAPLPDPAQGWEAWTAHMRSHPGSYKGLVKRACKLDSCRVAFIAALDGLHRGLLALWLGQGTPPGSTATEVRLIFSVKVVCAVDVANPSVPQDGSADTLPPCRLVLLPGVHLSLRTNLSLDGGHICKPPPNLRRAISRFLPTNKQSHAAHLPLLRDLEQLDLCPEEEVWTTIEAHIAPLPMIRETVQQWRTGHPASEWHQTTAESMLLLLDPGVTAENFPVADAPIRAAVYDVPVWPIPGPLCLSLTGQEAARSVIAPCASRETSVSAASRATSASRTQPSTAPGPRAVVLSSARVTGPNGLLPLAAYTTLPGFAKGRSPGPAKSWTPIWNQAAPVVFPASPAATGRPCGSPLTSSPRVHQVESPRVPRQDGVIIAHPCQSGPGSPVASRATHVEGHVFRPSQPSGSQHKEASLTGRGLSASPVCTSASGARRSPRVVPPRAEDAVEASAAVQEKASACTTTPRFMGGGLLAKLKAWGIPHPTIQHALSPTCELHSENLKECTALVAQQKHLHELRDFYSSGGRDPVSFTIQCSKENIDALRSSHLRCDLICIAPE